eukprot:1158298-Pelagomonas_calceolata.AAC.7
MTKECVQAGSSTWEQQLQGQPCNLPFLHARKTSRKAFRAIQFKGNRLPHVQIMENIQAVLPLDSRLTHEQMRESSKAAASEGSRLTCK